MYDQHLSENGNKIFRAAKVYQFFWSTMKLISSYFDIQLAFLSIFLKKEAYVETNFFSLSSSRIKICAQSSGHRTTPSLWKDANALRYDFAWSEHFHHLLILSCHKQFATNKMTVILSEISQLCVISVCSENKSPGRWFTHSNVHERIYCMHWRSHSVTGLLKVFHSSMLSPGQSVSNHNTVRQLMDSTDSDCSFFFLTKKTKQLFWQQESLTTALPVASPEENNH